MPRLSDLTNYILQSNFIFFVLILLCALPVVIYRIRKGKNAWTHSPRNRFAVVCALTVSFFIVFTFYQDRLEPASLRHISSFIWYIIWAVLLLGHWGVWFLSIAKDRKPNSLSFLLPCLLFLAVGVAQENWLLTAIMAVYAAACFIPKGAEI